MSDLSQPGATRLSDELIEGILAAIGEKRESVPVEVRHRDQHSNDFAEIRLATGRVLIVKRGRHEWAAPRFRTSQLAARLIREATGVAVPDPLPLPNGLDEQPLEAYWRIELPTLQEVWPGLDGAGRREVLRSWGTLTARLHTVSLRGWGPLADPATESRSLGAYLRQELAGRLRPGIRHRWPEAAPLVDLLLDHVDEVEARVGDGSWLVHNDQHMGNVLCRFEDGLPHCVGLLDLETAVAAPRESDLAIMGVHHGPHFAHPVEEGWLDYVLEGYQQDHDRWVVAFYRILHYLNMGFYSALVGHAWHAAQVAEAARAEVDSALLAPVALAPTSG